MKTKTWYILGGLAALFLIFRYFSTMSPNADGAAFVSAEGAPVITVP
jgi:uncharacterized membrane protein YuzA (DUF378 family)